MSSNESDTPAGNSTPTVSLTGRCKWFNNKAGYGFVTVVLPTDSEHSGSDIFAHHSGINVSDEQYRYLVQGEYVNFELMKTDDDKHEYQAVSVTGVGGGKLMCETRNEARQTRDEDGEGGAERRYMGGRGGKGQRVRLRGEGVRDGEVWTLVKEGGRGGKGGRRPIRRARNDNE